MIRYGACFAACITILAVAAGCAGSGPETVTLFNGQDFDGWVRYVEDGADVNDVWSIRDGVIHCSGVPNGYIRTAGEYSDYILRLEWRWPGEGSNSGVFLHAEGPDKVWPQCIECQLKAGSAGDFVIIGGGSITVDGEEQSGTGQFLVIPKMADSSEKPTGEWNTYEIECRGAAIACSVNGVLQNSGTNASRSRGWICLQSEGGPIEFRNITLRPLD